MHLTIEPYTQGVWVARVYAQTLGSPRIIAAIARCTVPAGGVVYVCGTYLGDSIGARTEHPSMAAVREHIETLMAERLGLPPECFDPLDPRHLVTTTPAA